MASPSRLPIPRLFGRRRRRPETCHWLSSQAGHGLVMAFVPNEIWIHENDSVTWKLATDEAHTVSFLYEPQSAIVGVLPYPVAQQRPSNAIGCTAYGSAMSPNPSAYDPSGTLGLQCVHSGAAASRGALG